MTLVIDRAEPGRPMVVTWLDEKGTAERALAVQDGKVLRLPKG